jgi:hypothetical protein
MDSLQCIDAYCMVCYTGCEEQHGGNSGGRLDRGVSAPPPDVGMQHHGGAALASTLALAPHTAMLSGLISPQRITSKQLVLQLLSAVLQVRV